MASARRLRGQTGHGLAPLCLDSWRNWQQRSLWIYVMDMQPILYMENSVTLQWYSPLAALQHHMAPNRVSIAL